MGTANNPYTEILQRFKNMVLRTADNATSYLRPQDDFLREEIKNHYTRYRNRIAVHSNEVANKNAG